MPIDDMVVEVKTLDSYRYYGVHLNDRLDWMT